MSKLTTRGNKRIAAKIDIITANKRTIGATNAARPPTPKDENPQADRPVQSVSARSTGKLTKKKNPVPPRRNGKTGSGRRRKVTR